jgi:hypothetical protein
MVKAAELKTILKGGRRSEIWRNGVPVNNGAFARDLMVSNLGQMPYKSEFGKLKLEAVWGPTTLQGLDGEQNVGIATTNGAIRLLHASYSLIPHLLEIPN